VSAAVRPGESAWHRHLLSLLESVASDQHPELGGGRMSAVAYDTAWVAMVRDPHDPHELAFPRSFEWLLRHQATDGSWSGPFPHTLLPTLAGVLAISKAPRQTQLTSDAVSRAEAYLRSSLQQWSIENHESVGFEVVAPALLGELEKIGKRFDFADRDQLFRLHAKKLAITGLELVYSGLSNVIHSLEAFGSSLDFARLKKQQAANGAYGCSPAATAAVLMHAPEWDAAAARWLSHLSDRAFDGERGGMPNAYPIDVFEAAWVLYNLAQAGFDREVPAPLMRRLSAWLQESLTSEGASISRFSGIPVDSDDTGMVIAALNLAGVPTSADSLRHFERDTHFACFERERGASLSANAHTLAALVSLPASEQIEWASSIAKLIEFLYGVRRSDGSWEDKWHVSPFYATACTVLALAGCSEPSVRIRLAPTVEWILETRSERDGGWGADGSTIEETAYALQVLLAVSDMIPPLRRTNYDAAIAGGRRYLWERLGSCMSNQGIDLPPLWRGKELYTPARVIISAILATVGAPDSEGS
jgi:halimadienyl-diphosphate synthase